MTGIYCYNQMILSAFEILHIWKFYIIKSFFKKIGFSFKLWCKISEISVLIHLSTQSSLKTKPCPSCSPGCPWWLTQCWYKGINMRSSPWSGTLSKDHQEHWAKTITVLFCTHPQCCNSVSICGTESWTIYLASLSLKAPPSSVKWK